jgi:Mechanosensitive ion channel
MKRAGQALMGRLRAAALGLLLIVAVASPPASGKSAGDDPSAADAGVTAPVVIDGNTLFRVRGISSLPAADRAARIAANIVKNEEVIVPNSQILNNEIVNFSSLAKEQGLILHTSVGIGYEVPWRQVEAMLLMAVERTPGLFKEPAPFVLQRKLGDFAVDYEVNVYIRDAHEMLALYTALHRSILDVFNEYGVQIMTPEYETDPGQPKVVPRDQWYAAPARRDGIEPQHGRAVDPAETRERPGPSVADLKSR